MAAKLSRQGLEDARALQGHVVILGFKDTALEIAEYFRTLSTEVLVIDLDYRLHEVCLGCRVVWGVVGGRG